MFIRVLSGFLICLLLLANAQAKVVIISDIDDTLKKTNNMSTLGAISHFIKNKPFEEIVMVMNDLVEKLTLQGEEVEIIYVSAGYKAIFDGEKFQKKTGLPKGRVILRTLKSPFSTFDYKYIEIGKILKNAKEQGNLNQVYLFGDNSAHDQDVYFQLNKELDLKANIFIRDVATWGTNLIDELETKKIEGIIFFFSEADLIKAETISSVVSETTKASIDKKMKNESLVPKYTVKTLIKRLRKQRKCIDKSALNLVIRCNKKAKKDSKNAIKKYYERYSLGGV